MKEKFHKSEIHKIPLTKNFQECGKINKNIFVD